MNIEEKLQRKFLYHSLNMDYSVCDNTEIQTNILINYIMNDFVLKYENDFKEKYVVYEYQDDIFSMIGYHILKHIQAIIPFNLLVYGKRFFKHYPIKDKFIRKKELYKLEDKMIFVSGYNSIYKVINSDKVFMNFNIQYNIIEKFTPEELETMIKFYQIEVDKRSKNILNLKEFKDFKKFCNGEVADLSMSPQYTEKSYYIVELTGQLDIDNEKINRVVDTDKLVFYKIKDMNIPILQTNFRFYFKNKSNIPDERFFNVNEDSILENLRLNGFTLLEEI